MSLNSIDEYWVSEHVKDYLRNLGFVLPLDGMPQFCRSNVTFPSLSDIPKTPSIVMSSGVPLAKSSRSVYFPPPVYDPVM